MEPGSKALDGRVVVVTGASRGIGREVALAVAEAGGHVIALARTVGALEELDDAIKAFGGTATLVPLDLKDLAGVDRLGEALPARFGAIHGLVLNAGVLGPISPLAHVLPKEWDETLLVNATANWRLLRALDVGLKAAGNARVVAVTSGAAARAPAYWGPYAVSKAALEALVRTYAAESRFAGVGVTLVSPGPMRTRMRAQAMPGEDPATLPEPAALAPHVLRFLTPDGPAACSRFEFKTGQLEALD